MSLEKGMFPPITRLDGLERLDLIDWDEVHNAVQAVLDSMNVDVGVRVKAGRNAARAWDLFSYRVFTSVDDLAIDPVVVGVVCSRTDHGFIVRGDITGETLGDVLFEVPAREVMGKLSVLEAVRDAAELLIKQAPMVAAAVRDPARSPE